LVGKTIDESSIGGTTLLTEVIPSNLLAERAALWVADRLWSAVAQRGHASLAVSGGSTPLAMFQVLAGLHLPWEHISIWQVDERLAPDGSPDRNAGQLGVLAAAGADVHLMPVTASDLIAATATYAAGLPHPFDVIHLGLGDDGHTASWPPGDPVLHARELVAAVGPFKGLLRLTLTPPVVNAAHHVVFLIAGQGKAEMLTRLLASDGTIPAHAVRRAGTTILTDVTASPTATG
jgi:6-phosphogluconolactonase